MNDSAMVTANDQESSFAIDKMEEKRDTPLNNLWEDRKNLLKTVLERWIR